MSEEEKKKAPPDVLDSEIRVAYDGPAIYTNRFFGTLGPGGFRLSFAEQRSGGAPRFRAAVQMSPQDAIELRNLLVRMLEDIDRKIQSAKATVEETMQGEDSG